MNKTILIGRLVSDPDIRHSGTNNTTIAKYRLAVDRRYARDGEQSADFISCVAFGKNGDFAEKYLKKGVKIAVEGHIQTGSYTNNDGNTVYTTDVVIDSHEFCESRKSSNSGMSVADDSGFIPFDDDDLPFEIKG